MRRNLHMKQYASSCDENRIPIQEVLKKEFTDSHTVLEIGSGTGQHAVYFAEQLPHLTWQPSDLVANHPSIIAWIADSGLDNVLPPLELDVAHDHWPKQKYLYMFSANTAHIMSWPNVKAMFNGIGKLLSHDGKFCLYGPFNYQGKFTSESNAHFDKWLKDRDPDSGIRHFEDLVQLATLQNMNLFQDYEMPVNNRMLVWRKIK